MKKNIISIALAVFVACGIGTSATTQASLQNKSEMVTKVKGSTILSDHYSKVEFTRSKDVKKIMSRYKLGKSKDVHKIIYVPINDYSMNVAGDVQKGRVAVKTRLASYSVKKQGVCDRAFYAESFKASGTQINLDKKVSYTNEFSNLESIAGGESALNACIKTAYRGYVTKNVHVKDILKISDKDNANVSIYILESHRNYQLWESDPTQDISSDGYLGSGTIKQPLGLIIMIS